MARSLRLRLSAGLAAGVVVAAVPIAATAASASTGPGPDTLVQVQPGMNAGQPLDAHRFGTTPASPPKKAGGGAASDAAKTVHAATGAQEFVEYLVEDLLSVLGVTNYSSAPSGSSAR